MEDVNVKKLRNLALIGLLTALISFGAQTIQADAADNKDQIFTQIDTGIGGMSALINDYYDDVLSESGISVSNIVTSFQIGGEVMKKVDRLPSMFMNLAVANVMDYVNIRSEASIEGEVVGRLYSNAVATVLGVEGEWVKISSGDVEGYIKTEYLLIGEDSVDAINRNYTKYARATSTTLNVREGAGTEFSKIGGVAKGEELEVLEELDEWVKVSFDSSTGYVSKNYVDFVYKFKYALTIEEALKLDEQRKFDADNMIWPMPSDHRIYTYYGYRVAPTKGASTYHRGLDIGGAYGSKIVAVLSGTVTEAGYNSTSGYYVEIDHGNGLRTRYLHNSKLLVSRGQKVTQGDVISLCGSTGVSTGPHLHFSVIKNGSYVDPYPYLKNVH